MLPLPRGLNRNGNDARMIISCGCYGDLVCGGKKILGLPESAAKSIGPLHLGTVSKSTFGDLNTLP